MTDFLILRHPSKIGQKLWPAGTVVRQATLDEARQVWPNMRDELASTYAAVWVAGMPHPTIMSVGQLMPVTPGNWLINQVEATDDQLMESCASHGFVYDKVAKAAFKLTEWGNAVLNKV
jgi:hypothetical protein